MKGNGQIRSNNWKEPNQAKHLRRSYAADVNDSDTNSECSDDIHTQQMIILDLLPEIIARILVRLPVKTLSILKCVNKYFSRFISCQDFTRVHFKFLTEDASMSSYKVMLEGLSLKSQLKQTSILSFCHDSALNFVYLDYPEKELEKRVRLVGSCNGLVVIIMNEKDMFLWNPAIKKHTKLPTIVGHGNLVDGRYNMCDRFYCGIGYDAFNVDHKVVALFAYGCKGFTSKTDVSYAVNVYSLKRNSWTSLPNFTVGEFTDFSGKFASGKLHWCTPTGDIVTFDVEREVFGTLERPNFVERFPSRFFKLRVLGGSIAVCCDYYRHVDVWVMKEYGMVASWTKMLTLSDNGLCPQPFQILPNGEVLSGERAFRIYNPKDNSWSFTNICYYNEPVIYFESLVSPCCN